MRVHTYLQEQSSIPVDTVICGDCRSILPKLQAESIDMVMFSPPYWQQRDYGAPSQIGQEETWREYVENIRHVCRLIWRVLKPEGNLFIVLGDVYRGKNKLGLPWRVRFALNERARDDRYDKVMTTYVRVSQAVRLHPLGRNPGDVWRIPLKPFKGYHFAVYPEELCVRPILAGCPPRGIVLDPMCGSGTTLVVAKVLGRHYMGIDVNPEYCRIARERLDSVDVNISRERYMKMVNMSPKAW